MSLEKQAKPILELIRYARGLDQQGKRKATRYELIASRKKAAESMGKRIDTKQAEREIDNARRRVRKAADKAEETLRHIVNRDALWDWTDPDRAIREMRTRHFGGGFAGLPMTDIEEALRQKGNVLFIIAVYPALKWAILARLQLRGVDNVPSDAPGSTLP
ncbi:hypothetical protein [Bradyrhizobium valentinum]|uniref:Uncharacterized protein n=1 Tax=Bradyrhizobium valentinum TaxID=1518501 RepID=A0A0R3MCE2_9BRAD|nr:hypothetical protein [Bradyrhizobium valentinum]KRR14992.1 hypothetical protein CP49_23555 [Bradyrhizobium valentinum]